MTLSPAAGTLSLTQRHVNETRLPAPLKIIHTIQLLCICVLSSGHSTHCTHTHHHGISIAVQTKCAHKDLCTIVFISDPYPNVLDNQAAAQSPAQQNSPLD